MAAWTTSLLLLLFATTILAIRGFERASRSAVALRDRVAEERLLSERADRIERMMMEDLTPRADSTHDPVWSYVRSLSRSSTRASLEDLSCDPGASPFVNLDTAEPAELRELFLDYGADPRRASAAAAIASTNRRAGRATTAVQLSGLLGAVMVRIGPLLTSEPMINVNLAPDTRLRLALARRFGSPATVSRVLSGILALRRVAEIDRHALETLVPEPALSRAATSPLGVRTWVWRLTVSGGDLALVRILARLDSAPPGSFAVIGNRFEPLGPPQPSPSGRPHGH